MITEGVMVPHFSLIEAAPGNETYMLLHLFLVVVYQKRTILNNSLCSLSTMINVWLDLVE